jgi:hypothetical protein
MARPRKAHPSSDPFVDLANKTEILEREMTIQRAAIERLKQLQPQSLRVDPAPELSALKRRISR